MANRNARIIVKNSSVAGKVPSGTTGDESTLIKQGELALNTADRKLYSYDGSEIFEIGSSEPTPSPTASTNTYLDFTFTKAGPLSVGDVINPPENDGDFITFGTDMGYNVPVNLELVEVSAIFGRLQPSFSTNNITLSIREYAGGGQLVSTSGAERYSFRYENVVSPTFTQVTSQFVPTGITFSRNNIILVSIPSPLEFISIDNAVINVRCKIVGTEGF